jgi:hypothetical protein
MRNLNTSGKDIEKLVRKDVDTFVKMFEVNDVHEADLSNSENSLFRRLVEKSLSRERSIDNSSSLATSIRTSMFKRRPKVCKGSEAGGDDDGMVILESNLSLNKDFGVYPVDFSTLAQP